MDESQAAFAQPYPPYSFDIDMMKRSMDPAGGPDSKKARWSPTTAQGTAAAPAGSPRDVYANYGYGGQTQASFQQQPSPQGYNGSPLYSTPPPLSINTQTNGGQMSPETMAALQQQQQQHQQQQQQQAQSPVVGSPYTQFSPYNMLSMGSFPYQQPNFQQARFMMLIAAGFSPQRLPALNISAAQAVYNPSAMSGMFSASAAPTAGRTVYIGNLPPSASVDELLNLVHFGPLESIRVLPEKSCVFLSFLDAPTAAAFFADATLRKLTLHAQELKIGWGKPSPVPAQVLQAIAQSGASRNVYLGGLDENMTEEQLRDELSKFGLIDQVKIVRDKNIGFVHFLSIGIATKVVNTLPTDPAWAGKRVNYGKDRCAYVPKSQQAAAHQAQAAAAQSLLHGGAAQNPFASPASAHPDALSALGMTGGNRTVYLGNIHPETTTEDLCNAIRGGVLQSVRYMADKHIAFITFIDPAAAFTFFQVSSYQGLTLNNRRLKIGWGKNSGPLPPTVALAVHAGATRNVYIGNVEDFEVFNEERLRADFGEFGDIELINFLKEKNCAFVNFTNIANAIKAIDAIKIRPEYANLRIAHGKDRCANPPRSGPQGGGTGARRAASGNGPSSAEPVSAVEPEGEMDFGGEDALETEHADVEFKTEQEGMSVEGGVAASS
ncbi:RNA-binding protein Nrd1 [Mycena pura]|uniref:RNA-binding protein Nrd1 n=1 Tax=Mycena pura TaxID=153505 RepID=A0AAD6UUK6_9AGAR|nr:RNA-binding protein Nrd1 [Mycena pura]